LVMLSLKTCSFICWMCFCSRDIAKFPHCITSLTTTTAKIKMKLTFFFWFLFLIIYWTFYWTFSELEIKLKLFFAW
jgi:hypothetical protein